MARFCCGRVRKRSYCPECGKHISTNNTFGLLDHCDSSSEIAANRAWLAEQRLKECKCSVTERIRLEKLVRTCRAIASRWSGWAKWVRQLIASGRAAPKKGK